MEERVEEGEIRAGEEYRSSRDDLPYSSRLLSLVPIKLSCINDRVGSRGDVSKNPVDMGCIGVHDEDEKCRASAMGDVGDGNL